MLRMTLSVVQVMDDARLYVSVHQEDPYDQTGATLLGDVVETYDMARRLDQFDEVTALVDVIRSWANSVICR